MDTQSLKKLLLIPTIAAASLITFGCGPAPKPPFQSPQSTPTAAAPTSVPREPSLLQKVVTSQLPAERYERTSAPSMRNTLPGPCYLIDTSASMNDLMPDGSEKKIDVVRRFSFPDDAAVYAFTAVKEEETVDIDHLVPQSFTPLYASVIQLLGRTRCGSLTIFTDGIQNDERVTIDDAIAVAIGAKVPLSVRASGDFVTGDGPLYLSGLGALAWQTGGTLTVNDVKVESPKE